MVSKEQIVSLLATKDKAVARALVVLNERQTADEQDSQATRLDNGMGFKPCHARMGTSMAQFYQSSVTSPPNKSPTGAKLMLKVPCVLPAIGNN
jgi:hypothetical protein